MRVRIRALPAWRCWILIPVLGLPACSVREPLNPVEGVVLFNKAPVKGALVTFHRNGADPITAVRPIGLTQEDGRFTVLTADKPGAVAGEYIVTFVWPKEVAAPKSKKLSLSFDSPETRDELDGAYANVGTSRFKVEIKRGDNKLPPFNLK